MKITILTIQILYFIVFYFVCCSKHSTVFHSDRLHTFCCIHLFRDYTILNILPNSAPCLMILQSLSQPVSNNLQFIYLLFHFFIDVDTSSLL